MTKAILGSTLFFVAAPSVLAGLIPWWMTRWEFLPPFFDLQATRAVGILLIVAGLPGIVDSFASPLDAAWVHRHQAIARAEGFAAASGYWHKLHTANYADLKSCDVNPRSIGCAHRGRVLSGHCTA